MEKSTYDYKESVPTMPLVYSNSDIEKGEKKIDNAPHCGDDLAPVKSVRRGSVQDAVFGTVSEDGPNYRNVGWLGSVALMMKSQIGLGVLTIPITFGTLGLIPGIIILVAVAVITTWSDYMVGVFKINHPDVYGIDDAMRLPFGRLGREFMGVAFVLYWIFVSGSGMLSLSIGLNALSDHGACTAIFVAVAAIAGFMLSSIRTLGQITWLAWIGLVGILSAIFVLAVGVGVEKRPAAAPQEGVWVSDYELFASPTFADAMSAVSSIAFAYAGTPSFFSIVSEMRDHNMYTRSLLVCQSGVTITYIVIGVVVYYYCGSYVASPALGSAGGDLKKVCYGLALPGLLVTTTLVTHIPAKYIFIRVLRGSRHLSQSTWTHWCSWLICTFGIALVAYIVASAIPVFDNLVSLVGALLGTLMSWQPMGFMWLYDNAWRGGKHERTSKWYFMACWSVFVIASGTFLMVAGTYGSVVTIINSYAENGGSAAWSCADNSDSS